MKSFAVSFIVYIILQFVENCVIKIEQNFKLLFLIMKNKEFLICRLRINVVYLMLIICFKFFIVEYVILLDRNEIVQLRKYKCIV